MLRQKVLPAILVILPATGALTAQTTIVEATIESCRVRPGSAAPAGSHWYYRINRGDNHRCWYLSSLEARSAPRGGSVVRRNFTSRRTRPAQQESDSEIVALPSFPRVKPAEAASALELATVEAFTARWPDLLEYEPPNVRTVATTSYTNDPAMHGDQISLVSLVDGERAGQQQTSAIFEPVILGGALMTVLLITGGVFRLTRRHGRTCSRDQRAVAGHVSRRSFSARTRTAMAMQATQPTVGAASAKRLA